MNILRQLNRSISAAIFFNIVLVLLWLLSAFLLRDERNGTEISIFNSITLISLSYFWSVAVQLICFALLAFFVHRAIFLHYFTITTYLPFSVIMLFGTVCKNVHFFGNQTVATIFLMIALWQFIKINNRKNNLATVFNTILFLIVAAFFVPEFFCFVPIFILGFIYFTEFKIRLLLVMLSSVLMPVLSAWGICFLCNNTALFNEFFKNLFVLSFKINIQFFGINFALFSVVFISFLVVSLFFFIKNIRNYKFRVRRFIFFLLLLWATTICLIMFYENKFNCFVAPCMILGSFFITLNFTNLHSKSNAIIFLIFLTVFSMIYAVQFI